MKMFDPSTVFDNKNSNWGNDLGTSKSKEAKA